MAVIGFHRKFVLAQYEHPHGTLFLTPALAQRCQPAFICFPYVLGHPGPGFSFGIGISNMAESDLTLQMMSRFWSIASPATSSFGIPTITQQHELSVFTYNFASEDHNLPDHDSLRTLPIHIFCATTTGTYLSPVFVMPGMSMLSVTKQWP